jgi:hypothetical protein
MNDDSSSIPAGARLFGRPIASIKMAERVIHVRSGRYVEVYVEYGVPATNRFAFKSDEWQVRELIRGLTRALELLAPEPLPAPHIVKPGPLTWRMFMAGNGAPQRNPSPADSEGGGT